MTGYTKFNKKDEKQFEIYKEGDSYRVLFFNTGIAIKLNRELKDYYPITRFRGGDEPLFLISGRHGKILASFMKRRIDRYAYDILFHTDTCLVS